MKAGETSTLLSKLKDQTTSVQVLDDDKQALAPSLDLHHERKVTRLEMWTDALASIVVTLTILPLMEVLNEPKEERGLSVPVLLFTVALGFLFMSYVMTNTYIAFNWFGEQHATDPVLHGLGLVFLVCMSLFAFAIESLLQAYTDQSAVYYFGGIFIGIYLASFLLFLYCLRMTGIRQKVSRQSAVNHELAFFVLVIATMVAMMIVSSFVSQAYQHYVMYAVFVCLLGAHRGTRTAANVGVLLPEGYPKERLDVFTDGVYAVAVTLFLIEIRYPASRDASEAIALTFIKDEWRAVVGHFVSFAVLGVHWCVVNFLSTRTERATSTVFGISMIHCLAVALFPFTVKLAVLGDYKGWEAAAPILSYANLSLTQLTLWLRVRGSISDKLAENLMMGLVVLTVLCYVAYEIWDAFA